MDKQTIKIYINGVSSGNPGLGAYGFIMIFPVGKKIEMSKFFPQINNKQVLLKCFIDSFELLPENIGNICIEFNTENIYLINGINKCVAKWKKNNWFNSIGLVKDRNLWEKIDLLMSKYNIVFKWINEKELDKHRDRCIELIENTIISKKDYCKQI